MESYVNTSPVVQLWLLHFSLTIFILFVTFLSNLFLLGNAVFSVCAMFKVMLWRSYKRVCVALLNKSKKMGPWCCVVCVGNPNQIVLTWMLMPLNLGVSGMPDS